MNIITAFLPEALSLIDHLGLKKTSSPEDPQTIFKNETHTLLISGMGSQNMINAINHLVGLSSVPSTPWLNLGIAGHGSAPIGSAHIVAKCFHESDTKSIYPPQLFSTPFNKTLLKTLKKPSIDYESETAFDMEGYSFFKTASKFCPIELIQSVKIISDNPENPLLEFNKSTVNKLFNPHIPSIIELINQMEIFAARLRPDSSLEKWFNKISPHQSFTETQTHQLRKAIRHAHTLEIPLEEIEKVVKNSKDSRSSMKRINEMLDKKRIFP